MAAALLAVLLLSSCGDGKQAEGLRLWFPVEYGFKGHLTQAVFWEEFQPPENGGSADQVELLMSALLAGPTGDSLRNPFPTGTRLLDWDLTSGLLTLDLSEHFEALNGVDLTLACYCLTLTMCQLEQVDQIALKSDGNPTAGLGRQILSPEDVIFTGAEEEPRQISVVFYFPRALGKGLGFETRELTLTEDDDLYAMIAQTLLQGPQDPNLRTLLPDENTLLGVWMDDGVCYINFSGAFLEQAPEEPAEQNLLLYSVVDTLGNLESVSAVQLLVEGERLPEFGGAETNLPLEPDFGWLSGG